MRRKRGKKEAIRRECWEKEKRQIWSMKLAKKTIRTSWNNPWRVWKRKWKKDKEKSEIYWVIQ